jgi:hypothetical protein
MKHIIILILIITALSCKAQSLIKPLGTRSCPTYDSNCYEKDVNNEFEKFVGEWKYENGNTSLTLKLKKELHYQIANNQNYMDLLVGEYQYVENGVEKANTLNDFNNVSISGYEHKIAGGIFLHRLPSYCTDNSTPQEIKIELFIEDPNDSFIEGSIFLRYVNDNGTEKLEACIQNTSTMTEDVNAQLPMPNGYYALIKQ